jgi:hypothetical protein
VASDFHKMTYVTQSLVAGNRDDNRNDNRLAGSRAHSYYQNAAQWPANAVLTCGFLNRCSTRDSLRFLNARSVTPGQAIELHH